MKLRDSDGSVNHIVPFSNGALRPPHVKRIGPAFPLFLKLEDMVTAGEGTDGIVWGGKPVPDQELADILGLHRKTVAVWRRRLVKYNYVSSKPTPAGNVLRVRKSKKCDLLRSRREASDGREVGAESLPGGSETGMGGGSEIGVLGGAKQGYQYGLKQLTQAVKQQPAADSPWNFLGIEPCGPLPFRHLLENRWASRNGQRASVLIGETIDAWEAAEGGKLRRAPTLFGALSKLRDQERQAQTAERRERDELASPSGPMDEIVKAEAPY